MSSVNPDLVRERAAAKFSREELTHIWEGGQQNTHKRRAIEKLVFADRDFDGPDWRHISRDEAYSEGTRKHLLVWKKLKQRGITNDYEKYAFYRAVFGSNPSGLSLHDIAFVPMLRLQGSDEQLAKWMPLIESFQIFGSYAQTEIGHGSYVRGLETTAVYDAQTKEFVLNSPTLSSTKWWIGSLGKTANYTILLAQLYTKGKCHGIQSFLVPLRDKNHYPLPGVTVGDIGPKFGCNSVDNGFLRLSNVRIPRDHMLMRFAQVLEDGTYIKPISEKIIYGGMLEIRSGIPQITSWHVASALTIAVRYSLVRRQSELKPGGEEPQILDFQTQQHKLFPLLALTYAFKFASVAVAGLLQEVMSDIRRGEFGRLIELHGLSAGLKAYTTTRGFAAIEICRLACGGHGYSMASNLPNLYSDNVSIVTAEGEAAILFLQTARYLIKNCISAQSNKKIDAYLSYLNPNSTTHSAKFSGSYDLRALLTAYEFRAARNTIKVAAHLQSLVATGKFSQEEAWNQASVQLVKAAVSHIEYVIMRLFVEHVENVVCSPAVHDALATLCAVYGIHGLVENAGDLLREDFFSGPDVDELREKLLTLYEKVRVSAIAYVDAFDIDDRILSSSLGRYDGNVYESLYEWAQQSQLNKTQVHESFNKYMKPIQAQSKL